MKSWTLFLLVLVPVLACGGLWFLGSRSARLAPSGGLVGGRLRALPASPNAVSSEEGTPSEAHVAPFPFSGPAGAAREALLALLRAEPRAAIVSAGDDYVHAVFTSRVFRFRDDVELRIDADEGVIHVRSASRVGRSDLGANRRRVEALRRRWDALAPRE